MHRIIPRCTFTMICLLSWFVSTHASAQGTTYTEIERGRYLTKAGDCMACHTVKGGQPYAGGFPVPTPFGKIYSSNITPDRETGIGKWSNDDFYKAMHEGIRRDGQHLYPAFPYPWYTKLSRTDVDAIKAYLDTLPAVKQENKKPDLPWPLTLRSAIAGWNLLFFHPGEQPPSPEKSAEWNRGAYLIEGAGHCAACHTPKNLAGGTKLGKGLSGGDAGDSWFAPALSGDTRDGIGAWSIDEIVAYLKHGANRHAASAGPMTEVIMNSTQYLTDSDLKAMAVYLKDLPHDAAKHPVALPDNGKPRISDASMEKGKALYLDNCIGCHMVHGEGQKNAFPPLKGSPPVQAAKADSVIQVILAGDTMADPATRPTGLAMPAFGWKLNDDEVADLSNYIRNAWGNHAPVVSVSAVAKVRKDVHQSGTASRDKMDTRY